MKQVIAILTAALLLGASEDKTAPLGVYKPAERNYWAFTPRRNVVPPKSVSPWVKTPVDAFILDGLTKAGLKPAPQADKLTLIRRVTYDLTGVASDA